MSRSPEDFGDMLASSNREKFYSALGPDGALLGFFSFIDEGDGGFAVGLGMRPDLTGRGLGQEFVADGLEFGRSSLGAKRFRLSVATFNERAIKVYERAGFRAGETFMESSGDEEVEFLRMTLD
jgi:ribosomal-protein-alanine N-acetyltransferase